jgi:hypothetical protein
MIRFPFLTPASALIVVLGGAGIVASTACPSTAAAQDGRSAARMQFDLGVDLFAKGQYADALVAFERAYNTQPHPVVRVNLASCHEKLNDPAAALTQYELFLSEMGGTPSDKTKDVQKAVRRLRREVGFLDVTVDPPNAILRIDGGAPIAADAASRVNLRAGTHSVEVSLEGYRSLARDVTVRAGKAAKISLRLDAQEITEEPFEAAEAPVEEQPALESEDSAADEDSGATIFTTRVLLAGGMSLGLLGGAIVTGVVALGAKGDFDDAVSASNDESLAVEDRRAAYRDGLDASDRADTFSLVSDVLLAGAVVGAGLTVYFILSEDGDEEAPPSARKRDDAFSVSVAPYVRRDGGGAFLRGQF